MASVVQTFEDFMSERGRPSQLDATLQAAQELQNRFISDNLRRIFRLIYRIVGNVADAQDLTQEAFIKALQRQDQLKDLEKAAHCKKQEVRRYDHRFCRPAKLRSPWGDPDHSVPA